MPDKTMRILLDSGRSINRNIGDNAILDTTVKMLSNHEVQVLDADSWNFFGKLLWCNLLWICCGGLFKHGGELFIARKFLIVAFARLLRKQVYVDSQTVFLRSIWRILFKIAFKDLTVYCRDLYSLSECRQLGLKHTFKPDLLIEPNVSEEHSGSYVVVGGRYIYLGDKIEAVVNSIIVQYLRVGKIVVIVPTIQTSLDWEIVKRLLENAELAVCASFHAAVFASNAGVSTVAIYDSEYYHRKFSCLNCTKIDLRKHSKKAI